MTPEKLNAKIQELINTINEYRTSPECPTDELERAIDTLLCKLPRDIVYMEWLTRSDIQNMADVVYDEPAEPEILDDCMQNLWDNDSGLLDIEMAATIVTDTVRNKGE